jgi:CheY-like chemotaxis protein
VDRLLHELRSTLARLKAEIELLSGSDQQAKRDVQGSVDDALRLLGSLEEARRAAAWPHVLVIDDDQRLASVTARQLRRLGFSTEVFQNLSAIPETAESGTRAIVDLSVLRLAKTAERDHLRAFRPIVVSGSSDPIARIEADSYGAADYLLKPVDPETLRATLVGRIG